VSGDLGPLVAGVDVTFHLAGLTRGSPGELQRVNVEATRRLVDALAPDPGHRLVFCSSQAAAGPGSMDRPRRPEDPPDPTTPYGRSKLAAEEVIRRSGSSTRATVIRAVAVYGPRDPDTLPFFRMAQRGWVITPGLRRRRVQLVHVQDLARAFRLAGEAPRTAGRTYFVGHPEAATWAQVVTAAGRAVGRRARALPVPSAGIVLAGAVVGAVAGARAGSLDLRRARDLVQRAWTCEVAPALRELDWSPRYDLGSGFRHTADWYREWGWR
jgi:dihydroflavonol-4-reductase